MIARNFSLLTSKPTLFACNVAESDLAAIATDENSPAAKNVKAVEDYARNHFATEAVVISAQIESELVDLSEEEARDYLHDLGVSGSGVARLSGRSIIYSGCAPTSRLAKKKRAPGPFILATKRRLRLESSTPISSADSSPPRLNTSAILLRSGQFAKAREAGKLRIEGKDYVVADGDVIEFRFNVSNHSDT